MEVAWQQMQLVVKTPKSEGGAPRRPEIGGSQNSPLRKFDDAANDSVQIEGTNFAATFSRPAGTLTSLVYDGREMLASDKKVAQASRLPNVSGPSAISIYPAAGETPALLSGPILQVYRAPTDNDKGFGKWLAGDWKQAGLDQVERHVDSFQVTQTKSNEVRVTVIATSTATDEAFVHRVIWTVRGDGSLDLDNEFEPSGKLPPLPRIGVVMRVASAFENFRWHGAGRGRIIPIANAAPTWAFGRARWPGNTFRT